MMGLDRVRQDGLGRGPRPTRLLLLDRDGTLNRVLDRRPPNRPEQVALLPNVVATLAEYVAQGWRLVIISNQGGVAHGYLSEAQAWAVQRQVIDLLGLPVAASYLCPHMANARILRYRLDCPNRKPKPGFIIEAMRRFDAAPQDCLFVGDLDSDRQAARAAGVPFGRADAFFNRKAPA